MDSIVKNFEYEVIKRRIVLSRKLKDLAETGKNDARLSELISDADIELAAAEDACRFSRFSVAALCLDKAEEAFARIETAIKEQATNSQDNRTSSANTYVVIDLSQGPYADTYPVSYMAEPPRGGFNTREFKTDRIVLRRIPPGTFNYLGKYRTILTKPYYIGLFEVTQSQWELVMGQNPSKNRMSMYPVERVFYETIRGGNLGAGWPKSAAVDDDSFIGRLRKRTQLNGLDLPTDAQWDYAFLAGATEDNCDQGELGRMEKMSVSSEPPYTGVGSYPPNPWGIYYTNINGCGIQEWCLDWYSHFDKLDLESVPFMDPKGPSQNAYMNRILRCFSFLDPCAFDSYSACGRSPEVWSYDDYHEDQNIPGFDSRDFDQSHTFGLRLAMHSN